jgi:hypothetical protein
MALAGMHRAMIGWLHQNAAKAQQVQDYERAWQAAMADSGSLIPCPPLFFARIAFSAEPSIIPEPG